MIKTGGRKNYHESEEWKAIKCKHNKMSLDDDYDLYCRDCKQKLTLYNKTQIEFLKRGLKNEFV